MYEKNSFNLKWYYVGEDLYDYNVGNDDNDRTVKLFHLYCFETQKDALNYKGFDFSR